MSRKKATATHTEESFAAEPLATATVEATPASDTPANGEKHQANPDRKYADLPEPREMMVVTLGPSNADPKMRLLRSFKYKQMQMQFDREPDDKYKEMLAKAGWRDRTEEEGIWTKQFPREGEKWQTSADAERLFKQIANEIRADKGLGAVMSVA